MNTRPFTWTHYQGKPAVYDKTARVFYIGFKTMREAITRANELNEYCRNADIAEKKEPDQC